MKTRPATHPEAVYLARALNLNIETVWETIRHSPFFSYADLELAAHNYVARLSKPAMDHDRSRSSV